MPIKFEFGIVVEKSILVHTDLWREREREKKRESTPI